uniref:Uncharacterized protein n=1 Tax=Physcomitrium patens TaxID=3218 RepID=A0A2K1K2U1_PHYPA|nr:hypothetical protein PHYPA_012568 [Physcomitrium patens]
MPWLSASRHAQFGLSSGGNILYSNSERVCPFVASSRNLSFQHHSALLHEPTRGSKPTDGLVRKGLGSEHCWSSHHAERHAAEERCCLQTLKSRLHSQDAHSPPLTSGGYQPLLILFLLALC